MTTLTNDLLLPNDLRELCRVCLQLPGEEECLDLCMIYDEDLNLSYSDCFTICTLIDLNKGENMPHNLCKSCGLELQVSYDFYKKLEESKQTLQQYKEALDKDGTKDSPQDSVKLKHTAAISVEKADVLGESSRLLNDLEDDGKDTAIIQEDNNTAVANVIEADFIALMQNDDRSEADSDLVSATGAEVDDNLLKQDNLDAADEECIVVEEHLDSDDCQSVDAIEEDDAQNNAEDHYISIERLEPPKRNQREQKRKKRPIPQDGPPYICEICGHKSNTKTQVASHRYRKHRVLTKVYRCPKCLRDFDTSQKLDNHIRRPTCDTYPTFTCEYCAKVIKGRANYEIHLRFHRKAYSHMCPHCDRGFVLAVHLKGHIQAKHENKRYVCQEPGCGKHFTTSCALKSHMYVHTQALPYKCEECHKMFQTKGRLRWHLRWSHEKNLGLHELDRMKVAEEIVLKAKAVEVKSPNTKSTK